MKARILKCLAHAPAAIRIWVGPLTRGRVSPAGYFPAYRKRATRLTLPLPFVAAARRAPPRLVVVAHIFHLEMLDDVATILSRMALKPDLLITTDTPAKRALIEQRAASFPGIRSTVITCENRGRDIAPKLVALDRIHDAYDLALFVHSKKSTHMNGLGLDWRTSLLNDLAGSLAVVESVLYLFDRYPRLGLLFPAHYPAIVKWLEWGGSTRQAEALARRLGIRLETCNYLDFASGSMFWVRPKALQPLLDLQLRTDAFEPELGQLDGTLAHAIERLLLFVVERAGYFWMSITTADSTGTPPAARDEAALDRAVRRARRNALIGRYGTSDPVRNPGARADL